MTHIMKEIENQLLILFSNINLNEEYMNKIVQILKQNENINWQYVIQMSCRQGINGIIYYHTQLLKEFFPRQVVLQYSLFNKEIINLENEQYLEYLEIYSDFIANNIRPVILKGFALSKHFFQKPGIRVSKDMDILIPSDKINLARQILCRHGYVEKCDIVSPKQQGELPLEGKYNQESIYLTSAHGNSKFIKNKDMFIELHHTAFYFGGLDLTYIYNNSVIGSDGIYYLEIVDMFLFTCVHFWQHFRGKMDTAALTLRCYSDIKAMYYFLENENRIEELIRKSEKYEIKELVSQILGAVKHLVGGEYDKRLLGIPKFMYFESNYFRINALKMKYFFDKKLLASDLKKIYDNIPNVNRVLSIVDAQYKIDKSTTTSNCDMNTCKILFSSHEPSDYLFFDSHISSKFSLKNVSTKIEFDFKWNLQFLFLNVRYWGNHKYSDDIHNLHLASSYIKLKVFEGKKLKVYYIQPNTEMYGNLYKLDNNRIENSEGQIDFVCGNEYFDCILSIPWKELEHLPNEDDEIRFDIAGCYFDKEDLSKQYEMNFSEGNGYQGEFGFANKYIRLVVK